MRPHQDSDFVVSQKSRCQSGRADPNLNHRTDKCAAKALPGSMLLCVVSEIGDGAGSDGGAEAMTQRLVLENFPRPEIARALSPNGRVHWATRRRFMKIAQDHVGYAINQQRLMSMHGQFVTLWPTFIYPVARKRDDDNLATGVMKVVRDTLVYALMLADDDTTHLRQMPVEVRVEKGRRALELRFEVMTP